MNNENTGPIEPIIAVCGSINMDLVVRCQALPVVGQTVTAESATEVCGGKGANQAVAAAKAGGKVTLIGRVGDDAFANRLITNLHQQRVGCDRVSATSNCASGLAIVAVEDSGHNAIMLVPGANGHVSLEDIQANQSAIAGASVLLLQLEIPTASVLAAIRIARDAGVRCVLDPAPVCQDWTDELLQVDLVCPNETEAAAITGLPVATLAEAETAARQLQQRGARHVIITLGERGVLVLFGKELHHVQATPIRPVDTTAAGDAFAGALSVRWAETDDLLEAVRFASVAGALAATRPGAQPSLASRHEIESLRNPT
ncbi:ribokinase [Aureliella helgolandensis]|uniref:Ribokinase n=1 Tax=Aureliella helgolandensis TaxID=2527968 RepID=A0A518GC77_9BACT|nr:ribokinase [Aureliella helgolandensis]QDV26199.1 Ribokinase [Aureliella helgolandensis]